MPRTDASGLPAFSVHPRPPDRIDLDAFSLAQNHQRLISLNASFVNHQLQLIAGSTFL
jgi:hypothetical protein